MSSSAAVARANQSSLIGLSTTSPHHFLFQATDSPPFRAARCVLDLAAIVGSWHLTAHLREALNPWTMGHDLSAPLMQRAAPPLLAVLLLWALSSVVFLRLYSGGGYATHRCAVLSVVRSVLLISFQALAIIAFSREFGIDRSRSFVPLFACLSFLLLCCSCYLSLAISMAFESRWPSVNGVAVIGRGHAADTVVESIRGSKRGSLSYKGLILPDQFSYAGASHHGSTLGTTKNLAELINRAGLSHIIVADHTITETEFLDYCRTARQMGVTISRPLLQEADVTRISHFGLDLIALKPAQATRRHEAVKRVGDVVTAAIALVLLSPIFLACMLAIALTSKGPIFYKSIRVGRGGRYFTFWKFRSMIADADRTVVQGRNENGGHLFKIKYDPRITSVGRILRRYSLDEIPQLLNVLMGDMSIVGPRPLPAEDLEPDGMSRTDRVWAKERASMRPGITGLWQVSGRSSLHFTQMVSLDLHYTQHWSLALDLKILWMTPAVVLFGRGAY